MIRAGSILHDGSWTNDFDVQPPIDMTSSSTLAIIPARSGSKGLPDKNIRALRGSPLMAYAIENASESGVIDEVFVSTDSRDYAEIEIGRAHV